MHKPSAKGQLVSAVFLTFAGNCKEALTFYQACFDGILQFQVFDKQLEGCTEMPVLSGTLVSDSIVIHGSDLVHNEGRILGNNMAIFLQCTNSHHKMMLREKLEFKEEGFFDRNDDEKLTEVVDAFGVRWILC